MIKLLYKKGMYFPSFFYPLSHYSTLILFSLSFFSSSISYFISYFISLEIGKVLLIPLFDITIGLNFSSLYYFLVL